MTQTATVERRVSGVADRRQVLGRGGRRGNDQQASELDLRIACEACGLGDASLSSFRYERGQYMARYRCQCGHFARRTGIA
jgi:hypothetical protein